MDDSISDLFARSLATMCTDGRIRAIESGADDGAALWADIEALGFTDALVATRHDGAGLALAQVGALFFAAGRAGLSHPFGETMVARAVLRELGHKPDAAPIALARAAAISGDAILCREVPGANMASHVLVQWRDEWLLLAAADAVREPGTYRRRASATLQWESPRQATLRAPVEGVGADEWCNAVHAAAMAGAMERVLDLSVRYANDRRQFGRVIAQFQAVQQDLAVLAEQAGSAAVASRIGCASATMRPDPLLAATAKLRASEAALRVATAAHAVHGAIGITEEHVLGVFTARLHEARATGMGERACAERIGRSLLQRPLGFCDFVRAALAPEPVEA